MWQLPKGGSLYFFSLSIMFKSRHSAASAVGPIVTKNRHTAKYSYLRNSQNFEYKFAQKIL